MTICRGFGDWTDPGPSGSDYGTAANPYIVGDAFSGGGGNWIDWNALLGRGLDIAQTVLTPPSYRSVGPGGTVSIRANPPVLSGGAYPVSTGFSGTGLLLVGLALVALLAAGRR